MSKAPIYVVVVIYNKKCSESTTCQCLQGLSDIHVIIVDNSTNDYKNKEFAQSKQWIYINMNGNQGLSKAYNCAIEAIEDQNALICLFDDDSEVDNEYFRCLEEKAEQDPVAKVFLPLVYDDEGLLSPSIIEDLNVLKAGDLSQINSSNITGINSGMAIRRRVFNNYKYNEAYFLDYIDHAFLRDMKLLNNKISVMDVKMYHKILFENTDASVESVIKRMKIFKKDFRKFCGRTLKGFVFYFRHMYNLKKTLYARHNKCKKIFFA